MLAIEQPFAFYTDLEGDPLDNGSLFFGVVNQNPETNQIQVYWDAAGTQPAAQPVKTSNGVPVRNGTAAVIYAASDYSSTVKDKAGRVIYYAASSVASSNAFALQAEIDALTTANNASQGAGLIPFNPTLSYAAGSIGRDLLNDPINPHDSPWLVKGDGVTDDSLAIQAVINFANGNPVLFEARTYLLGSSIETNIQSGTGTYRSGTKIIGQGMAKTIFLNRSGGPAFKHTLTQAQGDASSFTRNVRFESFDIITDGSSPVGSRGIAMQGSYFPVLRDLRIFGMKGNGIEALSDARWANPDLYSNGSITVERCVLTANTGWAIQQTAFSNTFRVIETYTTANTGGGYYLLGSMHNIAGGAVAGNGSAADTSSGGIIFARVSGGSVQECEVVNCEIDSNYQRHVWFQGYNNRLRNSRIIDDATGGSFRCPKQVEIGGAAGETCDNNLIEQVLFRMSNIGAANTTNVYVNLPVTDGSQAARYNTVRDCAYSNSGATSGAVTNIAVQNSTNINAVGNKLYKDGQLLYSSSATRSTDRSAAAVAFSANYAVAVSPTPAAVVQANSVVYDTHSAYDNINYAYTAPYTGLLRIDLSLLVTSGSAGAAITIFFQRDTGGGYSSLGQTMTIRDGNAGTFGAYTTLQVNSGEKFRVAAQQVVGGTAVFNAGSGSSVISYSMV